VYRDGLIAHQPAGPSLNLTTKETDLVFSIMADLSYGYGSNELRRRVGLKLLDLLGAQYFASYVWNNAQNAFCDRVSINMSDDNLGAYEQYFQYCDPITPVLQRRRKATCVSEIMPRSRFERTEFFNDFLANDGLHFGVNYYAYSGGTNIGDLRIWRGKTKEDFSHRELEILDAIGPAFTNAMRSALARETSAQGKVDLVTALEQTATGAMLTAREKDICAAVLAGLSDQQIAAKYGISFTTVRSHLKHIYGKLGISGRTQLLSRVITH
jgi:DNA-binding CsgD family transcriptional regulator